ncbi:MAG: DEAD/DEAH box helicase [Verrucomicrobia bacterium]|nr:DEAD/DEAH box helicase [Verrucomicrobiota bacterium]
MTSTASLTLTTPLEAVPGLTAPMVKMLANEGIATTGDLLAEFPFRHEDRSRMEFKGFAPSLEPVCHHVRVTRGRTVRFGRRSGFFEAECEAVQDNPLNQQLTLRWFNMPFMNRAIAVDMELIVYGKIKDVKGRLVMGHPEYEIVNGDTEVAATVQIHTGRIVPIYRLRGGLKQKLLRAAMWQVLQKFDASSVADRLPKPKANGEFAGLCRGKALHEIHFPIGNSELELTRRYLALEEFYILQLRVLRRRLLWRAHPGWQQPVHAGQLAQSFLKSLPFTLTDAQQRSLDEIRRDMTTPEPMNRLLHGDVGSGKTVVALAAMLQAVEAGHQAALMAPTQILAEQHYANACHWLEPLGLRVALRTGERKEETGAMELFQRNIAPEGSARFQRAASGIMPDAQCGGITEATYSKRRLPHFERPWAKYMLTYSTRERRILSSEAREIVLKALLYFNQVRYHLLATVVMPDHVHILLEPLPASWDEEGTPIFHSLTDINHSIKSFTANKINKLEGSSKPVWEKESFDRMIRSESDLQEKFDYIKNNPAEAGIVSKGKSYPWSWPLEHVPQDAEHSTLEACAPPTHASSPHLLIGTHALLYDAAAMPQLGLAVIDEQHKFGVAQRARLIAAGHAPDVLVLTATPIPRTLALTVYGDLDISTIDEKPLNRGEIVTLVRTEKKLADIAKFVRAQIEAGHQAYIVYPLIDESDKLVAKAAIAGFKEWGGLLAPHIVGLMHGRIDAAAKNEVMNRFRTGEIKALVSTTVIEVGVDIPNASVMVIFNAERFGLAQLHQLRGRIGRGAHRSHCVLMIAEKDVEARERLNILVETADGFRIAEEDLRRRGPGDLLGSAQSGEAPLKFADLLGDTRLLTLARRIAERTLTEDPKLSDPSREELRMLVLETDAPAATLQ